MSKPVPRVTDVNRPFYAGGLLGELRLQRCTVCRRWIYFPRVACPFCLSDKVEWVRASGGGTVYSFAIVYRPQHAAFNDEVPIVLAAVALAEGPVMISEITGADPEDIKIGMAVEAIWEPRSDEVAVVRFRPVIGAPRVASRQTTTVAS
jgi:uncharacterized OB-fold protein